jgi:hypothetical protein
MSRISIILSLALGIGASCMAQNRLVIRGVTNQVRQADANKIYSSACLAVEREFRIIDPIRPEVTLILGAHENRAYTESKEIRLIDWDPELFAQGVVVIAFRELLPESKRKSVAKRADTWASSVVDARTLARQLR